MQTNPSLPQTLEIIGNNLYLIRHIRKEKLTAVAKSIGVSHPVISQIENGRYNALSMNLLVKLAAYYNVTIEELITSQTFTMGYSTRIDSV